MRKPIKFRLVFLGKSFDHEGFILEIETDDNSFVIYFRSIDGNEQTLNAQEIIFIN
jgi:hypothetical protein